MYHHSDRAIDRGLSKSRKDLEYDQFLTCEARLGGEEKLYTCARIGVPELGLNHLTTRSIEAASIGAGTATTQCWTRTY